MTRGLVSEVFVSAVMAACQDANRSHRPDYLSVPQVDIEYPVSVAVDLMTSVSLPCSCWGRRPQASYSMPADIVCMLSSDLVNAGDQVSQKVPALGRVTN